jgi:single-strand DNA-binding protein
MAKTVNKVILLGNVGKDPEQRATPSGTVIVSFSIATSERFKDATGNWADRTEWHNLVAFGKVAEIIRDYVKKGSKIYIEGSLRTSSWDDKTDGKKRYKTEVIVSDISLLSGKGEGGGGDYSKSNTASFDQRAPAATEDYSQAAQITDDDIPF